MTHWCSIPWRCLRARPARELCLAGLLLLCPRCETFSQVFGLRRPNIWYAQATPSLSIFFSHTGIDQPAGTTVSDLLCWGAGLTFDIGATTRRLSAASHLRLDYEESHSSDAPVVKGPSIFDLTIRSLYTILADSATNFGMALQGGCYTALLPETGGTGEITRRFFDPASLYEGLFVSREDQFGRRNPLKLSFQAGYSLQQLTYGKSDNAAASVGGRIGGSSTQNAGLTALFALELVLQGVTADQQPAGSFFVSLSAKGFRKETGFSDWKKSRAECAARIGFDVFRILEFVTAAELVYDSDISPRRDLKTTVSIGIKYAAAFSGNL